MPDMPCARRAFAARFAPVLAPVFAAVLAAGCAGAPPRLEQRDGPWAVARTQLLLPATPATGRELPLRVAWPRGARGLLPVVVYSHGAQCGVDRYAVIQDFWVSHGYVVLAPAHLDELGNNFQRTPDAAARLLATRLADVSYVVDSFERIAPQLPGFAGRLDAQRVAIAGHSFGGMIAQIKAGLAITGADGRRDTSERDPRFKVAVINSGVGPMAPIAADGFDGLTLPLFASGGTEDLGITGVGPVRPWRWRIGAYDLAPPGDKYAVWLQDGDHYLGGLICRGDRVDKPDPVGARIVAATSLLFLDGYLRGDARARRGLRELPLHSATAGRATLERR